MNVPEIDAQIVLHYEEDYDEASRLTNGIAELELVRTREIIERHLGPGRLRVLDVGGATGVHARWLARRGCRVELVDPMPRHVAAARTLADAGLAVTAELGDARHLVQSSATYDVVLLLGPLYHLTDRADRLRAWREALRVVKPGGFVFAAAVCRFASLLESLARGTFRDAEFRAIVDQDLRDGQHRNPERRRSWFTTAYFHHPTELGAEAIEAGAEVVEVVGVEGLAAFLQQLEPQWEDPAGRDMILDAARAIESEPTLLGLSPHLLAVTRRPVE